MWQKQLEKVDGKRLGSGVTIGRNLFCCDKHKENKDTRKEKKVKGEEIRRGSFPSALARGFSCCHHYH